MNEIKEELENGYNLNKNDIVVILNENDSVAEIIIPYGDLPRVRGTIDLANLSSDKLLFEYANQACIEEKMCYDSVNGKEIGIKSGNAIIKERKEGWVKIILPSDDINIWTKEVDLNYNFEYEYIKKLK